MKRARRRFWTPDEFWQIIADYPDTPTDELAARLHRPISSVHQIARKLDLNKAPAYLSTIPHRTGMIAAGARFRYQKGHVPANAGLRRPGWHRGRMNETWFKKGGFPINRDPDFYVLGALRVNSDGYIDMRISFEAGAKGWKSLHRILWEDAHGPIPPGHVVAFKDRDHLNVELDNLELLTRAENMKRNTIHNLPKPLVETINALGRLKRRINEKQNRRSAQPLV